MSNKLVFQMEADEHEFFRTIILTAYVNEQQRILISEELIELIVDKDVVRQRNYSF